MSDNSTPPNEDKLDQAIAALQGMRVPGRPPDQDVLDRLATLQETIVQPASIHAKPRRRFFMRPSFQFGMAATLLLALAAWLVLSSSTSVALSDVIQSAEKHKLVKYQMRQETNDDTPASTVYADLTAQRYRTELRVITLNGTVEAVAVQIQDGPRDRFLNLNTDTEIATGNVTRRDAVLSKLFANAPKAFRGIRPDRPFLSFLRELQAHAETKQEKVQLDGRDLVKFWLKDDEQLVSVWVDPRTKLPVRKEIDMTAADGNRYKFTFTDFEWDPKVDDPAKLFSTDPPEGYDFRDATNDGQ